MRQKKALGFVLALAVVVTSSCDRRITVREPQPDPQLKRLVEAGGPPSVIRASGVPRQEAAQLFTQVRRFYEQTGYHLIWVDGDHPNRRYEQLVNILRGAPHQGLDPRQYDVKSAPGLPVRVSTDSAPTIPNDRAAEFDVWVTFALFRYATHVSAGQLDPHAFESQWTLRPERVDLVKTLAQAVTTSDLSKSIDRLAPNHPEYVALQGVLDRYRAIQAQGGWPPVPQVRRLKEGESNPAVPVLRRRLVITGDLSAPRAQGASHAQEETSPVFDATLAEAVRRFQERHRLKADGIVKADVVAAMNVPVETRIRQLELNLERWRWLPDRMPDRYIRVNVPEYTLEAMERGQIVMDIRVIVGERELPTPIFADQMTSVVFSPYWNIPPSIVRKEMIPHAAADPAYLARNNIEVVRGTGGAVDPAAVDWSAPGNVSLRQLPGPRNALGLIKFVFPNNFNVYLHDTPADQLFARIERDFSHGCVRVEEPVKLAEYVLRDQPEWTPEKILAAMQAGRERHVALKTPIPVFLLYMTATADSHGTVRFFKDLYGHDAEQIAQLPH